MSNRGNKLLKLLLILCGLLIIAVIILILGRYFHTKLIWLNNPFPIKFSANR